MIKTIFLIWTLLFFLYCAYCVISDIDPFWFLLGPETESEKSSSSSSIFVVPPTSSPTGRSCQFEREDILNSSVFTGDGTQVSMTPISLDCGNCNQYIFKDNTGCSSYTFDTNENICPQNNPKCGGVCTASLAPSKMCPF